MMPKKCPARLAVTRALDHYHQQIGGVTEAAELIQEYVERWALVVDDTRA